MQPKWRSAAGATRNGENPAALDEPACAACQAECPVAANYCPRCGRALRSVMVRSATPISEVVEKWRKLSFSLTRKEVRKLLGEPLRIEVSGTLPESATETWTYEYETCVSRIERACGRVCISVGQSRVIGWNEPHWQPISGDHEAGE
jgi:hypothetical protein